MVHYTSKKFIRSLQNLISNNTTSTWQVMYVFSHIQTTMVNLLDLLVLAHIPQVTDVVNISIVVNSFRCMGLVRIFKYTR